MDDTNTELTNQPEQEKKQSLGNLLAAFGAASMLYMLTHDKRSEAIDTWKRDFLRHARDQNPELARIYNARTGFMRRLVSKQAREDFSTQLKEQARLERFTDSLFERTGTDILRGTVSAPDVYTIHENLTKLHPQEGSLISADSILQTQQALAKKYGTKIEQIEQKMSPRILVEKKQIEHEVALERLFDEVNSQKPKLDPKKREQILSVMKKTLSTGTIAIDPLRTDQFGEVVHEAYQKKIGVQTQLTPEELEHLYTFTEHYRNEGVLQEKTKTLFTKKSELPTPIEARSAVFQGFQTDFFTKATQEPGIANLLTISKNEHESAENFNDRLKSSSLVLKQLRGFSYEVTSFHDNLFPQLDQTPNLNQARVANANDMTNLLKKYPYLQKMLEGARIFQLQMETAEQYESDYRASIQDIPKQALPHIITSEDASTATYRFETLLRTGNLSEEEIQKRVHAYQKTAKQVMDERMASGPKVPLYETIFDRYAMQNPAMLPQERAALVDTQGQMDQLSRRIFMQSEPQQEQQKQKQDTSLGRKLIKRVLSQNQSTSQLSLRSYTRGVLSWFKKSAEKLFSGTLRTGSELLSRAFARPALSSAGSSAGRMASNQAMKMATRLVANIPIVRVVIIAVVVIILVVFLMVGLDTKTMLAAQPYEMQQNVVQRTADITAASVVTIPTQQPNTPYVSAPESLSQIVEFASEKTQTPVPLLLGISHVEAPGTWNYSKEELTFYDTHGWWTTQDITIDQIRKGYGYDTCTGYIPNDSVHGGEQTVKRTGTICIDYPDGTKSQVMGAMQFNILTWRGFADKIKQALSLSREPDRRVLAEAFMGAGFFVKGRSGASSATSWNIMEIIKASAAYHTGGTKCSYAYGKHTGNYCREVCIIYNQYSQQYGAEPVDCSVTLQY